MDREERVDSFLMSLEPDLPEYLERICKEAIEDRVPVVRPQTRSLLRFLVKTRRPQTILEVGTATGFSALLMWEASDRQTKITTIEKFEKRIPISKEHFALAGAEDMIDLIEGDAMDILRDLSEKKKSYPFVFMDAAKGQYIRFLPYMEELIPAGGLLITDNVLQEGDVLESRYAVTRRDRTIHSRMREYLYELTHRPQWETTILNIGDGIALSVRK